MAKAATCDAQGQEEFRRGGLGNTSGADFRTCNGTLSESSHDNISHGTAEGYEAAAAAAEAAARAAAVATTCVGASAHDAVSGANCETDDPMQRWDEGGGVMRSQGAKVGTGQEDSVQGSLPAATRDIQSSSEADPAGSPLASPPHAGGAVGFWVRCR